MNLTDLVERGRTLRVVGFDDGPGDSVVPLAGVVCAGTRMEGLLWTRCTRDGLDGTEAVGRSLRESKFAEQVHLVLTDGITVGGLNVLDLAALNRVVGVPCVAVMRRPPDLERFDAALSRVEASDVRRRSVRAAGPLQAWEHGIFQVVGEDPAVIARVLPVLTCEGHVPECLRLAHLITGAVATGSSGRRA